MRLAAVIKFYTGALRALVHGMALIAQVSVLAMMSVTCADVLLRLAGRPLVGAYDLVKICALLAVAGALPYTTAVKGQVAIEFFFHKLGRRGRVVVDTANRLLGMGLFAGLCWRTVVYAQQMRASGEVTMTLALAIWPVVYVLAAALAVVVLVILHNLLHPGKEMIKP